MVDYTLYQWLLLCWTFSPWSILRSGIFLDKPLEAEREKRKKPKKTPKKQCFARYGHCVVSGWCGLESNLCCMLRCEWVKVLACRILEDDLGKCTIVSIQEVNRNHAQSHSWFILVHVDVITCGLTTLVLCICIKIWMATWNSCYCVLNLVNYTADLILYS